MQTNFILPNLNQAGVFRMSAVYGGRRSPLRKTTEFEIELPLEKGGYSYIDGNEYPVLPNRILCIKPNMQRYTQPPFECYYLHLSVDEGELFELLQGLPTLLPISNYYLFQNAFLEIIERYQKRKEGSLPLYQSLFRLFSMLKETSKTLRGSSSPLVEESKSYIEKNLARKITLGELGNAVGYNPVYLHRAFKKETGVSPIAYLLNCRMERAKTLLRVTDKSPLEIAEETGFCTQSYFNLVFKKQTGITPTAYRKEYYKTYFNA